MPTYTVNGGVTQMQLPDGRLHNAGDVVFLTEEQYGLLDNSAQSNLTLQGTAPAYGLEIVSGVQTAVGANGSASALTTPAGYVPVVIGGTEYLLALFTKVAALAAPVLNNPSTATSGGSLAAGTYYYKLTAINSLGESLASNEKSQATTGSASTVTVTWSAISGATGYKLYRGTAAGAENALVATLGAVTTYTDLGAATTAATPPTGLNAAGTAPVLATIATATTGGTLAATTYYYVLTAVNSQGETVASNELSQATSGSTSTVTVTWTTLTGATGYKLYRGTAAGGENALVSEYGATVTTATDTGAATTAATPPTANTSGEPAPAERTGPGVDAPVPYVGPNPPFGVQQG